MKKRWLCGFMAVMLLLSVATALPVTVRAASSMKASENLISVLKAMEGFSAKPYWDYAQWTVGYGTKCPDDKLEYYKTYGISEADAQALLDKELVRFETAVNKYIDKYGLSLKQHQFDALVSFSYNCGEGWMSSTNGYFNTAIREGGTASEILYGFCLYSSAGGSYILTERRLCEADMYINGVYKAYNKTPGGRSKNLRCVYLDGNGGEVRYTPYGFDANAQSAIRVAFSSIPTGVDQQGNAFVYQLEGWYTADGMKVEQLDHTIQHGEVLFARWTDPQGNVVDLPKGEKEDLTVTITSDSVNVRSGPASFYPKVGKYLQDTTVRLTQTYQAGNYLWGKTGLGWFRLDYSNYDQVKVKPSDFPKNGTITTNDVNIRTGPGTSFKKVGQLDKGQRVVITEEEKGGSYWWGKMTDGNWVCLDYVLYDENAKSITKVTLWQYPDQLTYVQKAKGLKLEGSVLLITYSDGTSEAKTLTRSMITQFSSENPGQTEVKAVYEGYTVRFPITITKPTVTFRNWDGTVISSGQYAYGETVTPPGAPVREDEGIYTYTFSGWDKPVTPCAGDTEYTALFQKVEKAHDHPVNGWYLAGSKWYYYENDTLVRNQWIKYGVSWLWLTADGSMLTDGWAKKGETWYYMGADGYVVTNSWKQDSVGRIYLDSQGCITKNAWVMEDGVWRWLDQEGYMARSSWVKSGTQWYYLNRYGQMATEDWALKDGSWYFLDSNGHIVKNAWKKDSKGWMWLGADGAMVTNTWLKSSTGWYYLGDDGYWLTNGWAKDSGGWRYLDSEGTVTKNRWVLDGGKWYFLDGNGYMVSNTWKQDSHGWMWLGSNGAMATNAWILNRGKWYFLGDNGYMVSNAWVKDARGWMWLGADGTMATNVWIRNGGKWYFLDGNGYMVSNTWKQDSYGWMWLGSNGAMVTNAWIQNGGKWYFLDGNGYMVSNQWCKASGGWCWLGSNGAMATNAWVYSGGYWYWMNGSGYMVSNTSVKISGKTYRFNASGVCTNP